MPLPRRRPRSKSRPRRPLRRPLKKRLVGRRKRPYARKRSATPIGPYAGRFKRRRKSRAVRKPMQGNKDSVFGTITAQEAAYSGFSTCGGRTYAIKQFAEQLLKQVCYERKIDIRGRTEPIPWNNAHVNHLKSLRLHYRHIHGDGTVGDGFNDVSLTTTLTGNLACSYDEASDNIRDAIKQVLTIDGTYFYGYQLLLNDVGGTAQPQPPDVVRFQMDTWRFKLSVYISYKIQNITPADGVAGTTTADPTSFSKDSIMANPLKGRSYEFSPGYPRVRPAVLTANSDLQIVTNEYEDYGFVEFPASTSTLYNPGNVLHDPPPGGTLFQNCQKGATMHINPGNFKVLTSRFTFSGTVKQLCKKLQSSGTVSGGNFCRFTLGNTVCFGLVPTMRTKDDENVKLAYQYDITSRSSLRPKYKCTIPRSNNSHLNAIGFASYTFVPEASVEPMIPLENSPPASQGQTGPTIVQSIPLTGSGAWVGHSWSFFDWYQTIGTQYFYQLRGHPAGSHTVKYDYSTQVWSDGNSEEPHSVTHSGSTVTGDTIFQFTDPYYGTTA